MLFDKDDPTNPVNRRISIIVMSNKATEALQGRRPDERNPHERSSNPLRSLGVSDAS